MSTLRKYLKHVPGVGHVLDVVMYAMGEVGDATLFGYYAAKAGLEVATRAERKALREASASFVAHKGTPTLDEVRECLGL